MRPKISVVMASYNREKEIAAAIDSVLVQDFQDFELIVVDDGSTDRTAEIVRRYGDKIRLLQQQNQGVGAARNAGIRAARGEYLCYCDADDIQLPFRLRVQAQLLDRSPDVGMTFADFRMYVNGEVTSDTLLHKRWLGPTPRTFAEDLEHHFQRSATCESLGLPVPAEYRERKVYEGWIDSWLVAVHPAWGCAQMSRLEAVKRVGGHWEAIRAYEDWVLSSEISKRYAMSYLDVPICKYRLHPEQLTGRARLNAECYRDGLLHTWKADPKFYSKHKAQVDRAMATAYAICAEVEAKDGHWDRAEEFFRRAVLEDPRVGTRPYVNLVLSAAKSRLGPFGKLVPGLLGQ
jgi:glycosyltransferase involved in cell wall biosynthesis